MNNCTTCDVLTSNPKFCSKSCAAKFNNKTPKRKITRLCTRCDQTVLSYRHSLCGDHWEFYKKNQYQNKTIGEYREKLSVKGKPGSWTHVHIRSFARSWHKDLASSPCAHCGYSKHVEIAHIRAVTSFPDTALLSEVNALSNLLPLCPNCHWEFDNLPRSELITTTLLNDVSHQQQGDDSTLLGLGDKN